MRSFMRSIASILLAAFLGVAGWAQAADVHEPPLGFITIDTTPDTWSQLRADYKFKGKVGDALKFNDIDDMWVLRCNMQVINSEHITNTVENAIPPQAEFLDGIVPENVSRIKNPPLLTMMFKTRRGAIGLMNIYPRLTIIELNSRYGAVLNQQR